MSHEPNHAVPRGLADLPLEARRARDVQTHNELNEGLTRRHLANAEFARLYLAVQFARVMRAGPAIAAKLRGD